MSKDPYGTLAHNIVRGLASPSSAINHERAIYRPRILIRVTIVRIIEEAIR